MRFVTMVLKCVACYGDGEYGVLKCVDLTSNLLTVNRWRLKPDEEVPFKKGYYFVRLEKRNNKYYINKLISIKPEILKALEIRVKEAKANKEI